MARINEVLNPRICLISEFGEELKGYRKKLTDLYNKAFDGITLFITTDRGFKYNIVSNEIYAIYEIEKTRLEIKYEHNKWIEPTCVETRLLRKDYSLHYYNKDADFEEELDEALRRKFDKGLFCLD